MNVAFRLDLVNLIFICTHTETHSKDVKNENKRFFCVPFKQKRPLMSSINTLSPLTPNSAEWLSNGGQTSRVRSCLCTLSHVLRLSRVHLYEHQRGRQRGTTWEQKKRPQKVEEVYSAEFPELRELLYL